MLWEGSGIAPRLTPSRSRSPWGGRGRRTPPPAVPAAAASSWHRLLHPGPVSVCVPPRRRTRPGKGMEGAGGAVSPCQPNPGAQVPAGHCAGPKTIAQPCPCASTWRFSSSPSLSSGSGGAWRSPCPWRAAARFSCCPRWYFWMRAWSRRRLDRMTALAMVRAVALISKMVCTGGESKSCRLQAQGPSLPSFCLPSCRASTHRLGLVAFNAVHKLQPLQLCVFKASTWRIWAQRGHRSAQQ